MNCPNCHNDIPYLINYFNKKTIFNIKNKIICENCGFEIDKRETQNIKKILY